MIILTVRNQPISMDKGLLSSKARLPIRFFEKLNEPQMLTENARQEDAQKQANLSATWAIVPVSHKTC